MIDYLPIFSQGVLMTLTAWISSGFLSLSLGLLMGVLSCNYLELDLLKKFVRVYTFVSKGIPAYVQILIAYFIVPSALGIDLEPMTAACFALAFCSGGYITEIIRSGINSVPKGQWDATIVLGYSTPTALVRIILPQTFKNIGPALFGEFEQLLKSTSLLATIGITELTRSGMNIISRELNPAPVYMTVAAMYLVFSLFLNLGSIALERKLSYDKY